jgi:hypothetical protein
VKGKMIDDKIGVAELQKIGIKADKEDAKLEKTIEILRKLKKQGWQYEKFSEPSSLEHVYRVAKVAGGLFIQPIDGKIIKIVKDAVKLINITKDTEMQYYADIDSFSIMLPTGHCILVKANHLPI